MAKGMDELARDAELEAVELAEEHVAVTNGIDQELADSVRPRILVPTEREVEMGVEVDDYEFAETIQKLPRRKPRQLLVDYAKDLDPKKIGGPKLPLIVLSLTALLTSWDDQALVLLLPEMRAEFAFSLQFLITLGSILQFVSILLAPAMGYLADRVKRVWMLRTGSIVSNLSSILQGAAGGIPQLVLGRTLAGIGGSVAAPAGFPILSDSYPSRSRGRVFAFLGLMGGIGGLLGPIIAGNLAEIFSWRAAIIVLGILASGVTLLLFFLNEPIRGYHERMEMGATAEVAAKEQEPVSWAEAWRAARSITTLRRLWYATPFLQIGSLAFVFVGLYFAEEFGLGPAARGYLATASGLVAVSGLLFAGPFADRLLAYKPGRVMGLLGGLLLLQAASIIVLVVSGNLWLSILVSLPLGFVGSAINPALATLISLVVPPRIRGLGLQTIAPWQLFGILFNILFVGPLIGTLGLRKGMLSFIPLFVIGAFILASSAFGVDRDIRAAKAASMADEEARKARSRGKSKMIICRDVDVTYDGVQVLFGVDFDVEEGEIVALLGTNGAGKSTLLRAISGVSEASNGAIFLDGQDITHVPPHENAAKGVVMVPGGHAIFPTLSIEDNLRCAAYMYRDDDEYVKAKTEEVLNFFPVLRDRLQQPAGNLSGGEQQMVALGQAFLMRPRILMIDELSLGLAPQIVEQLLDTLREIHAQGTTIILVEQSINVALTIAKRAVFMEKGEIRFDGPTEELLSRPELVRSVFMGGAITGSQSSSSRRKRSEERERRLLVENISVSFGGVRALSGAGLEVNAREIVGIIGPNGAGKTTLFDTISGFVQPDDGAITLESTDVTNMTPDARARLGLGRSFQNARLFPSMTVRENIAVAFELHVTSRNPLAAALWTPKVRTGERKIANRVQVLIEILGLQAYADKFVNELSTGTRRTVDIACVMASEPRVLMLDEPSSGLAQAETEALGPVLMRLVRDTGAGLLVIEHDMPLITSVSDKLVAMELGAVIATGTPAEVMANETVTAAYLAASDAVVSRSGTSGLAEILNKQGAEKKSNKKRST